MIHIEKIDRLAVSVILFLSIIIAILIWGGNNCTGSLCIVSTKPEIKEFSWQDERVGVEDKAFILTFDRPMNHLSVEKNLVINPPLPGKTSWAGRRLAYTLTNPIPYGETYEVQLESAKEQFRGNKDKGEDIKPFVSQFKSRDRAFAYIGTEKGEEGQLIIYNLTRKQKSILTPPQLVVMEFEFYPHGDKILFSATEKSKGVDAIRELQLYEVATGLNDDTKGSVSPQIKLVLDNIDYQNNGFDLSGDGDSIVVQRINRKNPADFDLWLVKSGQPPEKLNTQGGEFKIAPDGKTLAVAQGEGISLLPLKKDAKPLDFLPKFGRVLSFSNDGSAAVMVNFNTDNAKLRYTRSLVYVNNRGLQKTLLNIQGSILDCHFSPNQTDLYCLLTQLIPGDQYVEKPYFAKIDINTSQVTPLLELPDYRDIKISLSPDGLAIIFDQVLTNPNGSPSDTLTTDSGETIASGRLWMLIPPLKGNSKVAKADLEELPLAGVRPQWSP
ncbi:MAG: hypothetical protein N5P05_000817 [Chroococcopsis gigantea SAG 12.99]|jgi:WD40 repeat protein|nr:hypothetical protein [Chroococcopsis gigantea SAG 12.99]